MKAVSKKLFSLMLVAILLVSAVPFQVFATEEVATEAAATVAATEAATEAPTEAATEAPTEAATEAPTEAPTQAATEAPAAEEKKDDTDDSANKMNTKTVKVYFQLMDKTQIGSTVKVKRGEKIDAADIPSAADALKVFAQVNGSSTGYEFVKWVDSNGTRFTSKTYISDNALAISNNELDLFAVIEAKTQRVTLDANGGTCSRQTHKIQFGTPYGSVQKLPTPTRDHYTFNGWYRLVDGEKYFIDNDTICNSAKDLIADWTANKYTVTFQRYDDPEGTDMTSWVDATSYKDYKIDVKANSTLSVGEDTFPSDAEIKSHFALEGFEIVGWEIENTDKEFVARKTKVTKDIIIRPRYQKNITLFAKDEGHTTRRFTVEIGERFGKLPNPGARDGYTFEGWYLDEEYNSLVSNVKDLDKVEKHRVYFPSMKALYGNWEESILVYLYIYTDGKTDEHTKMVRYYDAPADGIIYLNEINMYSIFSNYTKYDDEGDEVHGWYDAKQWDNYRLGKPANEFEKYTESQIAGDDILEFYIMLIDNGNNSANSNGTNSGNNYNNNSATADPSNPSTGDTIFVAVTVMVLSLSALVLVFFFNKKRSAKK